MWKWIMKCCIHGLVQYLLKDYLLNMYVFLFSMILASTKISKKIRFKQRQCHKWQKSHEKKRKEKKKKIK